MEEEKLRRNFGLLIEARDVATIMLCMKKANGYSNSHFSVIGQIKTDIIKILSQVDPFDQDRVNAILNSIDQFPSGLAKGKQKYLDLIVKTLKQIEF